MLDTLSGWPIVTFPAGDLARRSRIFDLIESDKHDACFVILQESCFHPRDFRWPDQPCDKGSITAELQARVHEFEVLDVVKMIRAPEIEDAFDLDIKFSKREMPRDARLLAAIKCKRLAFSTLKQVHESSGTVFAQVDAAYRQRLSLGHTLGHLASYVLNERIAQYWRKAVPPDSRGYPDFIQLSQVNSEVYAGGTRDVYRLGKSLRKQGLRSQDLINDLGSIQNDARAQLELWFQLQPTIWITCAGPLLDDSRTWHCRINDVEFSMFCGGTHLQSLEGVTLSHFQLNYDEVERNLVMVIEGEYQ